MTPQFKAAAAEVGTASAVPGKAKATDVGLIAAVTAEKLDDDGFKAEGIGHHRKFGWLSLKELEIDERIQRAEVISHVNRIARKFREELLGTAVVSARFEASTGKYRYFVLDGQQRRAGALKYGFTGNIRVDVHYNLTLADEARLFLGLNERKPVQPVQMFKDEIIAGNPDAIAVQKILDDLGVPFGTSRGYSGAKSALRLVARGNGSTTLRWALTQVQKIYDADGKGSCYDASVVEAFFWLYEHHGIRVDEDNLYAKLSRQGGGTDDLVGHAKTIKSVRGGRIGVNLIRAIIARYNQDKRSARTRLPDWTLDSNGAIGEIGTD